MSNRIAKILSNKIFLYLGSRYVTYAVQFITSLIIANKLGPYYFGVYGFFLLLLSYLEYVNFGISDSLNVLLVRNLENEKIVKDYIKTALILISVLSFLIFLIGIFACLFDFDYLRKFEIEDYIILVCVIGAIYHINCVFAAISRIKNRLFEMSFQQTCIPVLVLISVMIFDSKTLLVALVLSYVLGEIVSLVLFIKSRVIPFCGSYQKRLASELISSGFLLFIYNSCFFFIIIVVRTFISNKYSVEEFGYFTFSYLLANSFLMLFKSFLIVIYPKILYKLKSTDTKENIKSILFLKDNCLSISYGLIFCGMIFFPIMLNFFPEYKNALFVLNITSLSIALTCSNIYGYYLMAQSQFRILASISAISLFICILLSSFLSQLGLSYDYMSFSLMGSYFTFSMLLTICGYNHLYGKIELSKIFFDFLPFPVFVPYCLALMLSFFEDTILIVIPFIVCIILNFKRLKSFSSVVKGLINSPEIINL